MNSGTLSWLCWQSADTKGAARVDAASRRAVRHDTTQQANADSTTKPPSGAQFREVFLGVRTVEQVAEGSLWLLALPSHTSLGVSSTVVVTITGE